LEAPAATHKSLKRRMADRCVPVTGSPNQTTKDMRHFKTEKEIGPQQLHLHVHPFICFSLSPSRFADAHEFQVVGSDGSKFQDPLV
jgi:hypothetical protein